MSKNPSKLTKTLSFDYLKQHLNQKCTPTSKKKGAEYYQLTSDRDKDLFIREVVQWVEQNKNAYFRYQEKLSKNNQQYESIKKQTTIHLTAIENALRNFINKKSQCTFEDVVKEIQSHCNNVDYGQEGNQDIDKNNARIENALLDQLKDLQNNIAIMCQFKTTNLAERYNLLDSEANTLKSQVKKWKDLSVPPKEKYAELKKSIDFIEIYKKADRSIVALKTNVLTQQKNALSHLRTLALKLEILKESAEKISKKIRGLNDEDANALFGPQQFFETLKKDIQQFKELADQWKNQANKQKNNGVKKEPTENQSAGAVEPKKLRKIEELQKKIEKSFSKAVVSANEIEAWRQSAEETLQCLLKSSTDELENIPNSLKPALQINDLVLEFGKYQSTVKLWIAKYEGSDQSNDQESNENVQENGNANGDANVGSVKSKLSAISNKLAVNEANVKGVILNYINEILSPTIPLEMFPESFEMRGMSLRQDMFNKDKKLIFRQLAQLLSISKPLNHKGIDSHNEEKILRELSINFETFNFEKRLLHLIKQSLDYKEGYDLQKIVQLRDLLYSTKRFLQKEQEGEKGVEILVRSSASRNLLVKNLANRDLLKHRLNAVSEMLDNVAHHVDNLYIFRFVQAQGIMRSELETNSRKSDTFQLNPKKNLMKFDLQNKLTSILSESFYDQVVDDPKYRQTYLEYAYSWSEFYYLIIMEIYEPETFAELENRRSIKNNIKNAIVAGLNEVFTFTTKKEKFCQDYIDFENELIRVMEEKLKKDNADIVARLESYRSQPHRNKKDVTLKDVDGKREAIKFLAEVSKLPDPQTPENAAIDESGFIDEKLKNDKNLLTELKESIAYFKIPYKKPKDKKPEESKVLQLSEIGKELDCFEQELESRTKMYIGPARINVTLLFMQNDQDRLAHIEKELSALELLLNVKFLEVDKTNFGEVLEVGEKVHARKNQIEKCRKAIETIWGNVDSDSSIRHRRILKKKEEMVREKQTDYAQVIQSFQSSFLKPLSENIGLKKNDQNKSPKTNGVSDIITTHVLSYLSGSNANLKQNVSDENAYIHSVARCAFYFLYKETFIDPFKKQESHNNENSQHIEAQVNILREEIQQTFLLKKVKGVDEDTREILSLKTVLFSIWIHLSICNNKQRQHFLAIFKKRLFNANNAQQRSNDQDTKLVFWQVQLVEQVLTSSSNINSNNKAVDRAKQLFWKSVKQWKDSKKFLLDSSDELKQLKDLMKNDSMIDELCFSTISDAVEKMVDFLVKLKVKNHGQIDNYLDQFTKNLGFILSNEDKIEESDNSDDEAIQTVFSAQIEVIKQALKTLKEKGWADNKSVKMIGDALSAKIEAQLDENQCWLRVFDEKVQTAVKKAVDIMVDMDVQYRYDNKTQETPSAYLDDWRKVFKLSFGHNSNKTKIDGIIDKDKYKKYTGNLSLLSVQAQKIHSCLMKQSVVADPKLYEYIMDRINDDKTYQDSEKIKRDKYIENISGKIGLSSAKKTMLQIKTFLNDTQKLNPINIKRVVQQGKKELNNRLVDNKAIIIHSAEESGYSKQGLFCYPILHNKKGTRVGSVVSLALVSGSIIALICEGINSADVKCFLGAGVIMVLTVIAVFCLRLYYKNNPNVSLEHENQSNEHVVDETNDEPISNILQSPILS